MFFSFFLGIFRVFRYFFGIFSPPGHNYRKCVNFFKKKMTTIIVNPLYKIRFATGHPHLPRRQLEQSCAKQSQRHAHAVRCCAQLRKRLLLILWLISMSHIIIISYRNHNFKLLTCDILYSNYRKYSMFPKVNHVFEMIFR